MICHCRPVARWATLACSVILQKSYVRLPTSVICFLSSVFCTLVRSVWHWAPCEFEPNLGLYVTRLAALWPPHLCVPAYWETHPGCDADKGHPIWKANPFGIFLLPGQSYPAETAALQEFCRPRCYSAELEPPAKFYIVSISTCPVDFTLDGCSRWISVTNYAQDNFQKQEK